MGNQVEGRRTLLQTHRAPPAPREDLAEEYVSLTASGVSVARNIAFRVVAHSLLSHLSRRIIACALLAGFQVFVFGYLGHLPNSQSAIILASPMIDANARQRSHAVLHQENET
jgi:hypothetical protein